MNSCLLIGWFGLFSGGQDEVGEVLEHPVVLEGVIDDSQEFAGQSDVRLAAAAPALDVPKYRKRVQRIGPPVP
jgi:hypothetical protein